MPANFQFPGLPYGMRPFTHRVQQYCDICGLVDDHPRHHVNDVDPRTGAPLVSTRHFDCCVSVGCPDGSCPAILATANGAHGLDLVDHVLNVWGPDHDHAAHLASEGDK